MPKSPQRRVHCDVCGRKDAEPFCDLAAEDDALSTLNRTNVDYRAGQVIFHEGHPPVAIYCISRGGAKVFKSAADGGQVILRVLGPGDLLGYRAVLADEPYAATAEAIAPTSVCVIMRETLMDHLRASPSLCLRFLAKTARELRMSEEHLMTVATDSVRKRLSRHLLLLLRSSGEPLRRDCRVPAVFRRSEMAQMIGTTPETVSRTLGHLAHQGIIQVTRTEIRVLDPERLKAAASEEK